MKEEEGQGQPGKTASKGSSWSSEELRRLVPLVLIAFVSIAAMAGGLGRMLRLETILTYHTVLHDYVDRHELLSGVAFAGIYVIAIAFSLPAAIIFTISGGFLFGWLYGGMIAVFAKTVGSLFLFLIARYSFSAFARRRMGSRFDAVRESFREDSFFYMLFLRLQPVIPFWVVNLGAALFDVPLRRFVGATIIGIAPAAFIFATAGAGLDSVIAVQKQAFEQCLALGGTDCTLSLKVADLLTPTIAVAATAMAFLSLIPIAMKRLNKRKAITGR